MEISVNEQTQRFYLAFDKWQPVIGHEIKDGKYRFCAVPLPKCINVSEVNLGVKVFSIPMSPKIMMVTETKEGALTFFECVGGSLKRVIDRTDNFDEKLAKMKKIVFERLGEMPPIENVDTDWVMADVSEILN